MVDAIPVLAFVRDHLEQIVLGAVGLVLPIVFVTALEAIKGRALRKTGTTE